MLPNSSDPGFASRRNSLNDDSKDRWKIFETKLSKTLLLEEDEKILSKNRKC